MIEKSNLRSNVYDAIFPIIVKSATNTDDSTIDFLFNFSDQPKQLKIPFDGQELLSDKKMIANSQYEMEPWSVKILERIKNE